jgi:hypothetical protein
MAERPEYVCETTEDSEDAAKVAAHFGLDAGALAAARDAQGSFSALGLGRIIAVYVAALGDQHPSARGEDNG